jgi:hypothetical protein
MKLLFVPMVLFTAAQRAAFGRGIPNLTAVRAVSTGCQTPSLQSRTAPRSGLLTGWSGTSDRVYASPCAGQT